jgi:hypothetical protein
MSNDGQHIAESTRIGSESVLGNTSILSSQNSLMSQEDAAEEPPQKKLKVKMNFNFSKNV